MVNTLRRFAAIVVTTVGATLLVWPTAAHADEIRDNQWHLNYLGTAQLHAITKGEGVTVAIVDSGVDGNHPDIKGNVLPGKDFITPSNPQPWRDERGHGTAMASLIAAHGHGEGNKDGVLGISPAAKILPVKATEALKGNELIADGIRWAVQSGAKVINISAGLKGNSPAIKSAIDYAIARSVVVVAAVGNRTQGDEEVVIPARYPGVIAVSGINQSGKFAKESVSGPEVVVAAPAVDIQTAAAGSRGTYEVSTGTSDATAIVSGIVALIRAKYPDLDAANVINRLIGTATDEGKKGRDPEYGYGIVNPLAALTKDVPKVDYNPLLPEPTNTRTHDATPNDVPTGAIIAFTGAGLALLIVISLVIALLVRQRNRNSQPRRQWPVSPPPPPPPH